MRNDEYLTLDKLKIGEEAFIKDLGLPDEKVVYRLYDLGLISDTIIKPLFKSMYGDTVAYLVKGSKIALRNEDASKILVNYRR